MNLLLRPLRRLLSVVQLSALPLLLASTTLLHAVSVHGTVTDPLGYPIANATVALVQNGRVLVNGSTGPDGAYTLVSSESGRFYVLASGISFRQLATESFFSGRFDGVEQNIVLEPEWVRESVVVTATGVPQPQAQVSGAVTELTAADFANRASLADPLRQVPGVNVVQTGQWGGETSLFIRGGSSTANRVVMDGVPVEDIGGRFDFGNVATTGIQDVEVYRGPNTVLYGSDAAAGVVALTTPRGSTPFPSLLYEGDAGSFGTYRNQAQLAGMKRQLDYYAGASSLYTTNALPDDAYHDNSAVANLGWSLSAKTQIRITGRGSVSATGLPSANGGYKFDVFPNDGKRAGPGHLRNRDHRPHLPRQLARHGALWAGAQARGIRAVVSGGDSDGRPLLRQRCDGAGCERVREQRAGADELRNRVSARSIRTPWRWRRIATTSTPRPPTSMGRIWA